MMSAFVHIQTFPDPVEAVFQALADPARLARWWGPDGFTTTIHAFQFAADGLWNFTMHGPDGARHENQAVFTEIIPNALVVIKHLSLPHFTLSMALESTATGTTVTWIQAFEDPAVAANLRSIVEPANEQNLARWAKEVATFSRPGA
jgi:uncharacterized protein YndB with AHSA1/START domain